jgi:hypothetical protein
MGISPSPVDVDCINEVVSAISGAVPPRAACRLVLTAAEAIDAELETIPAELAAAMEQGGHARILRRSLHRDEHLDQVERALMRN